MRSDKNNKYNINISRRSTQGVPIKTVFNECGFFKFYLTANYEHRVMREKYSSRFILCGSKFIFQLIQTYTKMQCVHKINKHIKYSLVPYYKLYY